MPIRLLKFDQDGGGITLVGRSQVIECISAELNSFPYSGKSQFEQYAILSHAWLSAGEITYSDWTNSTLPLDTKSPAYDKIAKFCKVASTYGLSPGLDGYCVHQQEEQHRARRVYPLNVQMVPGSHDLYSYIWRKQRLWKIWRKTNGLHEDGHSKNSSPRNISISIQKNWTPLISDNLMPLPVVSKNFSGPDT